ncbi:MAG: hypothetical protein AAF126_01955 [Chloroflexota bacterium]
MTPLAFNDRRHEDHARVQDDWQAWQLWREIGCMKQCALFMWCWWLSELDTCDTLETEYDYPY